MSNHTPGPWEIRDRGLPECRVTNRHGSTIAEGLWGTSEADANARLIAAAPELLDVLSVLLRERHRCFIPNDGALVEWDAAARAAIAKAKGGN